MRIISASKRPPIQAEARPTIEPKAIATTVASTPTPRLMRSPYRIALHRSRPCSSEPSTKVLPDAPFAPGSSFESMMSSWDRS